MNQPIGKFQGYNCFCTNMSYNCPDLSLFGFSSERTLKSAIANKIKRLVNSTNLAKLVRQDTLREIDASFDMPPIGF